MNLSIWGATDVGLKRKNNQDSILVNQNMNLYIIADGMGGHKGGEVASALAIETVEKVISEGKSQPIKDLIRKAYSKASGRIFQTANVDRPELRGMGTTMVVAYFHGSVLHIGNVGDSRAYLFKEGQLWQVTEDHSLFNEQIRAGSMSIEEIESTVAKNVITRSVGFEDSVQPDLYQRIVEPGETYLMCSDGLTGQVSDAEILDILANTPEDQVVATCIKRAKEAGGDDNISVIVFKVTD
ncbi:MAG: Stp1/IreP family PP2C-type Ser/Thr phosphatase [Bdellovibrionales bacterium]|nr:Stp1/IreP family PP2C-type Ser/Thr phosphatase [Bdellovibrionales bacterium]